MTLLSPETLAEIREGATSVGRSPVSFHAADAEANDRTGTKRRALLDHIDSREVEITALTAERDAMKEALREFAVHSFSHRTHAWCDMCTARWRTADPERHAPNCLAAPDKETT